jgi:hypothetical protein
MLDHLPKGGQPSTTVVLQPGEDGVGPRECGEALAERRFERRLEQVGVDDACEVARVLVGSVTTMPSTPVTESSPSDRP